MHRRSVLKLTSAALGAACAAAIGIPGVNYVVATVRRNRSKAETVQSVIRLKDLPVGRPVAVAIRARAQDAWTVAPQQVVGHVWLLRRPGKSPAVGPKEADSKAAVSPAKVPTAGDVPPEDVDIVEAFSATCPHLGCNVVYQQDKQQFLCPCHGGAFDRHGRMVTGTALGHENPAPRGLDKLACSVVLDAISGEKWVEVRYQRFQQGATRQIVEE
ncbi:MAG TPA: Rieske 2Fe-2S domain-containing protein [Pirellulales bacterium]|jgi:Rieske Fe-S protein|nr:Rieske 2Fe-2S domain-containing protein [Pirellulales bacterium]